MKYVLDTNIFRGLAAGDFLAEAAEIDSRLQSSAALPFFTCEVVIDELLVKLADGSDSTFAHIQSCMSWMERICGNSRVAPSVSDVMRQVLHNDPSSVPDDGISKRNQLRRQILKARNLDDLRPRLRRAIQEFGPYLSSKLESWAAEKDRICRVLRSVEDPGSRKASQAEIVQFIVDTHQSSMLGVAKQFASYEGQPREAAQVGTDFREFSYFEAALMMKAVLNANYSFAKHRNDYHDQMLCAYAGLGYVLMTRDGGIRDNLRITGCPNPRLTTLSQALDDLGGTAG